MNVRQEDKKIPVSVRFDPEVLSLIDEWKDGTGANSRTAAIEDIVRTVLRLVNSK
jgi:hypothetical protein